uniref:DUF659 domain-containing protein n=1 Tax=Cajanus cajan TaxID=3821 RepID=A0A151TSQ7_CAJCA|nr:hypothetical protein KK1_009303 [Cajanus cajan]
MQEDEEEDDIQAIARFKRPLSTSSEATSTTKRRGINVEGPLDLHFAKKSEESIKLGKVYKQTSLNDTCNKKPRARVVQYIARFFIRNGIPFNVAPSKSFKLMVEAIGTYDPHLVWTPCSSHCLDLILEDIGKIPKVKRVIQRGITLVGFIYNHLKTNLKRMFTSNEWLQSKGTKENKGKKTIDVILMPPFWSDVIYALRPIVRGLRLVDNEKKLSMDYIYEVMDREKYTDIFAIIDKRWDCQLHHPLHATKYYLNLEFF